MILLINDMFVETVSINLPTDKRSYTTITVKHFINPNLLMEFKPEQFCAENPADFHWLQYLILYQRVADGV